MGLSLKSNYRFFFVSCFDIGEVPRSPWKWNYNWLYFLHFIFTFEQCVLCACSWKNATVLQIKIWNSFCVHMAIVNQSGFFPKWMAFFLRWTAGVKWLVALRACLDLFFLWDGEIMNWMMVWGRVFQWADLEEALM